VKRDGNTPGRVGPELEVPDIPDEVTFDQLDQTARARLRTLSKDNAEDVGRHLVMAGKLLDIDPERAYKHAQVASARGGRVDIVREAAALTAYATGRFAEALKEFRTVRRLSGSGEHLALMADCERGLGRPERAIALAHDSDAATLDPAAQAELQIVIAGARMDMKDPEAAMLVLTRVHSKDPAILARIDEAKIDVLLALGRDDEAQSILQSLPASAAEPEETWADEVWLYDTEELPPPTSTVPRDEAMELGEAEDK
jgi:tetratricopeptide (TPR) repeat protein